jgi:hypothetical protein
MGLWLLGCRENPNLQTYDGAAMELGFSGAYEANYKGAVL